METGVHEVCDGHRVEAEDWDGYYTHSARLQELRILGHINTHNIRFGIQKKKKKEQETTMNPLDRYSLFNIRSLPP